MLRYRIKLTTFVANSSLDMEFNEIVSIAGIAGLKRIITQRPDGLIVCDLDGSNKKFMSNRVHMFTPLENISIYTETDAEPLANVFWRMKQIEAETPPVSPKSSADELKEYMGAVLPDYDRDQVFISDIKKLIKWFAICKKHDLVKDPEAKEAETKPEASETASDETGPDTSNDAE